MRIYLKISGTKEVIPFNYQHHLTSAIHKWIGKDNDYHDKLSLYSFSWLQNVDATKDGIRLKDNSFFFISANDEMLIKKITAGIMREPMVCFNAYVTEVQIVDTPIFSTSTMFVPASPIFIKRTIDDNERHFLYSDAESDQFLTETLQNKLKAAGLVYGGVAVSFNRNSPEAKAKLIKYKDIGNKVSICPVTIKGSPEQIAFAWNVGIGNSTGIGFGALK